MANRFKFRIRNYYGWFHPIMTWENHCFGWRKAGNEREETFEGYDLERTSVSDTHETWTAKERIKVTKWAYFKRHEEYPKNFLFGLLEFLMNIVSFVRVQLSKWAIIVGVVLTMFMNPGDSLPMLSKYLFMGAGIVYGLSFLIPILGFILRKVFKLDEKMDDLCVENGWKKWSEYEDS